MQDRYKTLCERYRNIVGLFFILAALSAARADDLPCPWRGKTVSEGDLTRVLYEHSKWLRGDRLLAGPNRANLCGAVLINLRGLNFEELSLERADLHDADLSQLDLTAINLRAANLRGAKLVEAKFKELGEYNMSV